MESTQKFIFNPEHDLCLASGDVNFIPPAAAVRFAQECKWIEKFMRAPGKGADNAQSGSGCSAMKIVPWGWDSVLKRKLVGEGWPLEALPSDEEIEFVRENSRRELAVELLERLQDDQAAAMPEAPASSASPVLILPSTYRIIARSLEEIESFLGQYNRIVLKAPLSGSGKGIRFVTSELMETDRGWCRKTIQKQGGVIVEQRKEIQQEFAMLFECTGASGAIGVTGATGASGASGASVASGVSGQVKVTFCGYSMFYANNGAYKGNILASDEHIENLLSKHISREVLHKLQVEIAQWLREKLQGKYTGFVGVDMFVCEGGILNPAMEINLRMTMGLIARNIYDFHKEEYGLGEGTHCFEPERGICKL